MYYIYIYICFISVAILAQAILAQDKRFGIKATARELTYLEPSARAGGLLSTLQGAQSIAISLGGLVYPIFAPDTALVAVGGVRWKPPACFSLSLLSSLL